MNWESKLLYAQNWNIGFCDLTPEQLVSSKSLGLVHWLKHPYKDRWFADPFILDVTEEEIVVLVEECPIENPKGILCELRIDRKSYKLLDRKVILELDTHLSYPFIIRENNKTYVCPENGASGKLNIYEYDTVAHKLVNPVCILEEALADSSIIKKDDAYYLIATKVPSTQVKAYLYKSDTLLGPYSQIKDTPVQNSNTCSRPAGSWFYVNEQLYRPAQICDKGYGLGMSIQKINSLKTYSEDSLFEIRPFSRRYNMGCHSINFHSGLCVVDSYGYSYPLFAKAYMFLRHPNSSL